MGQLSKDKRQWFKQLKDSLLHIRFCEKCGKSLSDGERTHAHRLKQRYILDKREFMMAAILCLKCHQGYDENWNRDGVDDFDPHKIMYDEITELINKREFYFEEPA